MKRRWHILAVCALAVAAVQALTVLDRIFHIAILAWKVGWDFPLITAGTSMMVIFAALTACGIVLGCVARKKAESFRPVATLSIWSLVVGGAIWATLIVSPIVVVVSR